MTGLPLIRKALLSKIKLCLFPTFLKMEKTFIDSMMLELSCVDKNAAIEYRINSNSNYETYTDPIKLTESSTIYAIAKLNGDSSYAIESEFFKIEGGRTIQLNADYANQYAAGGDHALIDYQRGGEKL